MNEIETEDCAAITFTMDSGALVTSSVTLGSAKDTSRLKLMFEGVTVESDQSPYAPAEKAWRFMARSPADQAKLDAVLSTVRQGPNGYAGAFAAMADALAGRPNQSVTLADGRRSIELVTAIYQSSRDRQPVELPLGCNHPLYRGWLP